MLRKQIIHNIASLFLSNFSILIFTLMIIFSMTFGLLGFIKSEAFIVLKNLTMLNLVVLSIYLIISVCIIFTTITNYLRSKLEINS